MVSSLSKDSFTYFNIKIIMKIRLGLVVFSNLLTDKQTGRQTLGISVHLWWRQQKGNDQLKFKKK